MNATDLVERAIEGAGGMERWESRGEVVVRIWSGGLAFASKRAPRARGNTARIATTGQRTAFEDYPEPGATGIFEDGAVRIERDGTVVRERLDPRSGFRSPRRLLWWDGLDMLYFSGQALWTYVSLPFVLRRPGYETEEVGPWGEGGERWSRLRVRFPAGVHTHSREQVLYLDEDGLIRRHDYTAEPFGRWAKAAHYCFDHSAIDGLVMPTRRRVYPRLPNDRRAPAPMIVRVELAAP